MDLVATIGAQLADLNSPLMRFARDVQAIFDLKKDGAKAAAPPPVRHVEAREATAAQVMRARPPYPGEPDHARARADAQRTIDSIDWTRPDIVIWVPATHAHSIPDHWKAAVQQAYPDGRASSVLMDYPAGVDFNSSVSTGMETLRLVLAEVQRRGGDHRVLLGGHSQGAWVIGEVMADPTLHSVVDRAVIYGHPSPAAHTFADGSDPKVRQVDDPNDPFTLPVAGDTPALQALTELDGAPDGKAQLGIIARTALWNPFLSAYIIGRTIMKGEFSGEQDPHHYEPRYAAGARFLRTGR